MNNIVAIVSRLFKIDDEAVIQKEIQMRGQQLEAIRVYYEFIRLDDCFLLLKIWKGKVFAFEITMAT